MCRNVNKFFRTSINKRLSCGNYHIYQIIEEMEKLSHSEGNKKFKKKYETFIYIWSYIHTYIYVRIYFTIILFQWKSLTYFQEIDRCLVVHTTHSTKTVNISLQFTDVEMLLHIISPSLFLFFLFFCFWTHYTIEYGKKIANCEPLIKTFSCSFSIFFFGILCL